MKLVIVVWVLLIKDHMEKKAAKISGSRPNSRTGSAHRPHGGHMTCSPPPPAVGVHGTPRNFNLKQQDDHHEKSFHRSRSFCGRPSQTGKTWEASASSSSSTPKVKKNAATTTMRRPKTHPELLNRDDRNMMMNMNTPVDQALRANKLLVNVTVSQSIGPLRLLLSIDATVEDAIKAALVLYAKEGRKPLLSNDPTSFGLHYSQFSIDCLNPADKIKDLGSRNFFLCPKASAKESYSVNFTSGDKTVSSSSSSSYSCGREIQGISSLRGAWYNKLLDCLLLPP